MSVSFSLVCFPPLFCKVGLRKPILQMREGSLSLHLSFLNLNVDQNLLEGLLKPELLGPISRVSYKVGVWWSPGI